MVVVLFSYALRSWSARGRWAAVSPPAGGGSGVTEGAGAGSVWDGVGEAVGVVVGVGSGVGVVGAGSGVPGVSAPVRWNALRSLISRWVSWMAPDLSLSER